MPSSLEDDGLDVDAFSAVVEEFVRIFIRLPSIERLSFTTLSVLHTLDRQGAMRLSELTESEQVSQPAITQLVARLERDGLVERRPDPRDGRAVLVQTTPAGGQVVRTRRDNRTARLSRLFERLTPEERKAVGAALPALIRMTSINGTL